MRRLKVHVDVRPLYIRQALQFELQILRDVVRLPQRLVRIHNDINLRNQPRPGVVHPHGVDLLDGRAVRAAHVCDELLGLDAGDNAHQQQELGERGAQPDGRDDQRDDDGAHGVDPPRELGTAHRGQDTEAVDEQVVAVVLPEDEDLRILVLEHPRVQEERELGEKGTADSNDRR